MNDPGAIAVIPCRFAAVRLPGKPLADIHGRPMLAWVVDRCREARRVGRVLVAADDPRIVEAARVAGAEAMLTRPDHGSGSDRVAEAVQRLGLPPDACLVNVQGDEPLIDPSSIDAVLAALDDPAVDVATAAAPLEGDPQEPSRVKVVTDGRGRALYFSRAAIPWAGPWRVHLGLYAFRVAGLLRFTALPRGPLEAGERLEQLRLLEAGLPVQVVDVLHHAPSVDTEQDLHRVRALLAAGT